MRTTHLWLLAFIMVACQRQEPPTAAPLVTQESGIQPFLTHYESSFRTALNATGCPGAAVVMVIDTTVVYCKGFGVKDQVSRQPVGPGTLFRIGSLSKGFAGILAAKLAVDGRLNLDEKVVDILPDFKVRDAAQTQRITVRHLLSHSTGLPRHTYTDLVESGKPLSEIYPELRKVAPQGPEGKTFAYQNLAFAVFEEILKAKTGKTYERLLRDELLDPSEMNGVVTTAEAFQKEADKALPHERNDQRMYEPLAVHDKYFNAVSVGGICASAHQMGACLQLLMGAKPEVLSPEAIQLAFTPVVESSDGEYFDQWSEVKRSHYGLGWRVLAYRERDLAYHGGFVNGYCFEIVVDANARFGACILFSAETSYARLAVPTLLEMYDLQTELSGR